MVALPLPALVSEHVGLVHMVVRRLERSGAGQRAIDYDEMVSAGMFGLLHAADAFDASRGVTFSTFAVHRIRGAIMDEIRLQDHAPRSVRSKARAIAAAREALAKTAGRAPDRRSVARVMGVPERTLARWEVDVAGTQRVSIDRRLRDSNAERIALPAVGPDALEHVLASERQAILRRAVAALPPRERTVVVRYYWHGELQTTIAEQLDVTESCVSQIRTRALRHLAATLAALRWCDPAA